MLDYSLKNSCDILKSFIWCSHGIAAIAPFTHRLTYDNLPIEIQRLRCKVNYEALRFVPKITNFGDTLISRLRYPQEYVEGNYLQEVTDEGVKREEKFVVLHLRFDKVLVLL